MGVRVRVQCGIELGGGGWGGGGELWPQTERSQGANLVWRTPCLSDVCARRAPRNAMPCGVGRGISRHHGSAGVVLICPPLSPRQRMQHTETRFAHIRPPCFVDAHPQEACCFACLSPRFP